MKDKNKARQIKEFESFIKKVRVNNSIWFDALSKTRKYDLFYEWKKEKYNSVERKKKVILKRWGMEIVLYPVKLKHFIKEKKKEYRYQPSKINMRESAIDFILNKK
jgi:hypothetical protein